MKQTPDAAVVHEFRALCLFALKRYDEAAAVDYAVLTAGPGWNWSTLVGLYPDVDTYTNQLRALEAYVRTNPSSASGQFLLAYHYLAQGNNDAAGTRFQKVVELGPNRPAFGRFRQALQESDRGRGRGAGGPTWRHRATRSAAGSNAPAAAPPVSPPNLTRSRPISPRPKHLRRAAAGGTIKPHSPSRRRHLPPTWSESGRLRLSPDVAIALTLEADGKFAWEVDTKGNKQTLNGVAGFKDNTLALLQQDGPPLVGKITQDGANKFVFAPDGAGNNAPGLTFTR